MCSFQMGRINIQILSIAIYIKQFHFELVFYSISSSISFIKFKSIKWKPEKYGVQTETANWVNIQEKNALDSLHCIFDLNKMFYFQVCAIILSIFLAGNWSIHSKQPAALLRKYFHFVQSKQVHDWREISIEA